MVLFGVESDQTPFVVHERETLVFVFKPHNMHTAPLSAQAEGTLLEWVAARFPEIRSVGGIKPVEPGLLHRLDHGTAGIVVFARTRTAFDRVRDAAESGRFVKEYRAFCERSSAPVPGTRGEISPDTRKGSSDAARGVHGEAYAGLPSTPFTVRSRFRAYGPAGRQVAPVALDVPVRRDTTRATYQTDVLAIERVPPNAYPGRPEETREAFAFRCSLARGFRHQVRVHLAALGFPILGDPLYGTRVRENDPLRLYAVAVTLPDPATGATIRIECESEQRYLR